MLKTFESITQFVSDLNCVFGSKQYSLLLYNRLLQKTRVSHSDVIKKHIAAFTTFITLNKTAIIEKDSDKIIFPVISYSEKVNIKMDEIFKMADRECTVIIWKHILVIMNDIDPTSGALAVLQSCVAEKSVEGSFLSGIMSSLQDNIDPQNSDPMSVIMGLMSSGALPKIMSEMGNGMKDGNLDMGKMLGSLQSMMSGVSPAQDSSSAVSSSPNPSSSSGSKPSLMLETVD